MAIDEYKSILKEKEKLSKNVDGASGAAENQNTTKKLKQHDDTGDPDKYDVVLSQNTANTMADAFFKFIEQEHLEQHLDAMSAGQILTLCILHSKFSWNSVMDPTSWLSYIVQNESPRIFLTQHFT